MSLIVAQKAPTVALIFLLVQVRLALANRGFVLK